MVARAGKTAAPLASLAALGVVFGDIGTSPLYALSTSFELAHDQVDKVVVYGTTSMVIWSITLVVTVLYVGILLRFDNEGEGGLLALLALLRRARPSIRLGSAATVLAVIGAAMFLGDSLITPAISVLSAVEGLETVAPGLSALVVPITLTVLFGLLVRVCEQCFNADRKGDHVLAMAGGHRYGVDHGLTFHQEHKLRTVLWGWIGEELSAGELAFIDRPVVALDGELGSQLAKLLTAEEIAALPPVAPGHARPGCFRRRAAGCRRFPGRCSSTGGHDDGGARPGACPAFARGGRRSLCGRCEAPG